MRRVAGDDQHERLDDAFANLARIGFQLDLDALVQAHAVFELDLLDRLWRFPDRREVLARDDGRLLHEAVGHRLAQADSRRSRS